VDSSFRWKQERRPDGTAFLFWGQRDWGLSAGWNGFLLACGTSSGGGSAQDAAEFGTVHVAFCGAGGGVQQAGVRRWL